MAIQDIGFSVRMSERTSPNDPYTPAQFAALFGKHPSWAYRILYRGSIQVLTGSPCLLIPRAEIDRFQTETMRHAKSRKQRKPIARRNRKATRRPKAIKRIDSLNQDENTNVTIGGKEVDVNAL